MGSGSVRLVIEPIDLTHPWVPTEIQGNSQRRWKNHTFEIDRVSKDFRLRLEIVPRSEVIMFNYY